MSEKCPTSPLTKPSSISDVQGSIRSPWLIKGEVIRWHELVVLTACTWRISYKKAAESNLHRH